MNFFYGGVALILIGLVLWLAAVLPTLGYLLIIIGVILLLLGIFTGFAASRSDGRRGRWP